MDTQILTPSKTLRSLAICMVGAALLTACGILPTGSATLNDPVPSGNVIYSGTFTGLNSQAVTGTASIYSQSAGSYTLRLDGLSAPTSGNLNVVVNANGGTPLNTPLRGTSGSQNYPFTSGTATFTSVMIHSTSANQDYGSAPLYATGTPPGS